MFDGWLKGGAMYNFVCYCLKSCSNGNKYFYVILCHVYYQYQTCEESGVLNGKNSNA